MKISVFASNKVRNAFDLLNNSSEVDISFTDFSLNPLEMLDNIVILYKSDLAYFHGAANLRILLLPFAKLFRKPVMLQWIGTDVLTVTWRQSAFLFDIGLEKKISPQKVILSGLSNFARIFIFIVMRLSKLYVFFLNHLVSHHTACSPSAIDELKKIGISATYLPILNHVQPGQLRFPKAFSILAYIGYHPTYDQKSFYGWHSLLRLAKDYPDMTIYIVGKCTKIGSVPENIIFLGFKDNIREVFSKVKALVRLTYYDSISRFVLEALATGRYVIHTQKIPTIFYVDNYNELTVAIEKVRNMKKCNLNGIEYIKENFSIKKISEQFIHEFNTTILKNNKILNI